jgi:hypothetical protein
LAVDHGNAAWKDSGQGQQGSKDGLLHATLLGDAGIRESQGSAIITVQPKISHLGMGCQPENSSLS